MPSKAPRPDFSLFLYSEGSPQTAAGGPRLPQAPAPHRPPSTPPEGAPAQPRLILSSGVIVSLEHWSTPDAIYTRFICPPRQPPLKMEAT